MSTARLAAHRAGGGDPLVLLHGIGSNRHVWKPVLPSLESAHDVIALDPPGFGDSPVLPGGATPSGPALTKAVEAELDALGIDAAHVAGNSMGGWIGLELARSGRARSVVCISPAGGWTRHEAGVSKAQLRLQRGAAKLGAPLAERLFRLPAARRGLLWGQMARGERMPAADAALATRYLAACPGWPETLDWLFGHVAQRLDEIECPVLIAWGTKDRLLPPRQGARLVERIPGAALRELPGVGHVPMYDDPELVAATILGATTAG